MCQALHGSAWKSLAHRHGAQLGCLDSLLLTRDCFLIIVEQSNEVSLSVDYLVDFEVGLQVSRNLYQYFQADAEIVSSAEGLRLHAGNIITIAKGRHFAASLLPSYPISLAGGKGVLVRDREGTQHLYSFQRGLGVICLRPLPQGRLELLIWGFDDEGLRLAARLQPMLTVSPIFLAGCFATNVNQLLLEY